MPSSDLRTDRLASLAAARLYLVCDATPGGRPLSEVLPAAIAGGVDVVQLRRKSATDEELLGFAREAQALCARHGALFVVNDRPVVAREAGADGVHVGQDDMPVSEVRKLVGEDALIGLSTHAPAEIDAAGASLGAGPDYIGVGPVHATPTKPGRPAVGVELVRYAAARARIPFFAIGGLHADNVGEVLDAGATRVCVLRAIADAPDPERAARGLRARIDLRPLGEDERPTPLLVAVVVAGVLAVAVAVGALTIHDLSRHGGSLLGGVFLACVLVLLAVGMYRRRYWAVLAFEALLAFQILVTSLALVVASTLLAAGLCLVSVALAGWLFWKLVRVMGRIQAGARDT